VAPHGARAAAGDARDWISQREVARRFREPRGCISRRLARQQILVLNVSNESDLRNAFMAITQRRAGAVLVQSDPFLNSRLDQIAALAAQHRVPAVSPFREFVRAGGLMSYGTDAVDAYRQLGLYVGKILKGAKPSELPVQQAVKVEFAINLKTARTLGLSIPLPLSGRADEVVE
jgi:putative tryptophan/tyrosine transport system substrate-binding protein